MECLKSLSNFIGSLSNYLIPKLQLGNAGREALASISTREARASQLSSQARAWELGGENAWKLEETSIWKRLAQLLNILLLLTLSNCQKII